MIVILTVEDRMPDWNAWLWTIEDLFDEAGVEDYEMMWAKTSDEALEMVTSIPKPATIVLDINLQGSSMDGIALCREIKTNHNGDTDCVILTTTRDPDERARAIEAGALGFFEKREGKAFISTVELFKTVFVDRGLAYRREVEAVGAWLHEDLIVP